MFIFWIAVYTAELCLTFKPPWTIRRYASVPLLILVTLSTLLLIPSLTLPFKLLLVWLAAFRIINLLRILKGRMHQYYLQHVSRRTSIILAVVHVTLFCLLSLALSYISWTTLLTGFLVGLAVVTLGLVVSAVRNSYKLPYEQPHAYLADHHLPTVTVAIPARNETMDLEQCIKSVLKSDYPKLEIIVLDDCSHDRTSEVIKSFAHDGVRFINGQPPQKRWLAKNQAYQSLYQHATGELVMFIGVDVRMQPSTIRNLVNTMYSRRKRMVSVMPQRIKPDKKSVLIQPLRYWWELVPPRRLFNRPPILSTCWIIDRDFLKSFGGFTSISHAILPEVFFAKQAVINDEYTFVRSTEELGLNTVKNFEGQRDTAVRVKYPQIRRRLENVLLVSSFLAALLALPIAGILIGLQGNMLLLWLGLIAYLNLLVTHAIVMRMSNPSNLLNGLITFPAALTIEVVLGIVSMYKYEFGTVEWKGRNVCIPAMHVYPKLPDVAK